MSGGTHADRDGAHLNRTLDPSLHVLSSRTMTSESPDRQVFVIAFAFPPDAGSGSLRNLKILKYLPANGWRMQVLTRRAGSDAVERSKSLVAQIPVNCRLIRTSYVDTPRLFGAMRRALPFRRRASRSTDGSASAPAAGSTNGQAAGRPGRLARFKNLVTSLFSTPDRYVGWLPFAVCSSIPAMRRQKADVIYAVGKPWTAFFVGYALKLWHRKPLVIDFMDPWTAPTWSWGDKPAFLKWIERRLEAFIVKRCDFIIANTETLREDFIGRLNVPPDRIDVLTCGYDEADFQHVNGSGSACPDAREPAVAHRPFTISHTGALYKKRSPLHFLMAVKQLVDRNEVSPNRLRIRLVGPNNIKDPRLDSLLGDDSLAGIVEQIQWVPHEEVLDYLVSSQLLLLIQPETMLQIPAKVFEYAASRRPILALAEPESAVDRLVSREGWGSVVDNDDVDEIARRVLQFYRDYEAGRMRTLEPREVDKYSTRALAGRLSEILASASNPACGKRRKGVAIS